MYQRNKFRFSGIEIKELIIAALAITLIFVWPLRPALDWLILFGYYFVFVGSGFVLHEVAHKLMAQSLGAWSEFRMWSQGLLFALFMRLIGGPVFIAPGATLWAKRLATREDHGRVALAGPVANILIALVFLALSFLSPVMAIGAYVNLQLAFFNLLPFGPLDGADIFRWKWQVWAALLAMVIALQQAVRYIAFVA